MDFGSAFDLVTKTFNELREQFEKNVREDWTRSTQEAKQLWEQAGPATREVSRQMKQATEQLSEDVVVEVKAAGQQIQAYLVSPEFEAQLDEWMKSAGLETKFENTRKKESESATDFANVHASVSEDPVDNADPFRPKTEDLDGRRTRVREKLSFLYRHHCDEILEAAKKGAFLGSILGPHTALRFALIAGGLRLGLILGGVTYVVLIKPSGEWSIEREKV